MSMDEFDMVQVNDEPLEVEIIDVNKPSLPNVSKQLGYAVANNLDKIIGIANDIVEIKRMQVQSDAVIAKLNAETERLRAEADNYVIMKGADTKNAVEKMDALRRMINDINASPKSNVPPEVLSELLRIVLEKS